MKRFLLNGPSLLNPSWFNSVRSGEHASTVEADGVVSVQGVELQIRGGETPAAGTAVKVWLNSAGFFVCATWEDIEQANQDRHRAKQDEAEANRLRKNALRADALKFNATLRLPVQWDVRIKDVLSGLSESSWGDGRSRATVSHIHLLEPLRDGRFVRGSGDFLCTSASGTNGRRYCDLPDERVDGDGMRYQAKVTCKTCIAIAARWSDAADEAIRKHKPVMIKVTRNRYGNLKGYEGAVVVRNFSDSEFSTAEADAIQWLSERLAVGGCVLSKSSHITASQIPAPTTLPVQAGSARSTGE